MLLRLRAPVLKLTEKDVSERRQLLLLELEARAKGVTRLDRVVRLEAQDDASGEGGEVRHVGDGTVCGTVRSLQSKGLQAV